VDVYRDLQKTATFIISRNGSVPWWMLSLHLLLGTHNRVSCRRFWRPSSLCPSRRGMVYFGNNECDSNHVLSE
jgi:hypothetical protein